MSVAASAEIMGMPINLQVVDDDATEADAEGVFDLLRRIDRRFSTYKADSETERISRGELSVTESSPQMRSIVALCERTRAETNGFFDAFHRGRFDPSGVVKGYAIEQAANLLRRSGFSDFYVEAGGDIQTAGRNERGEKWRVGIRSPFDPEKLVALAHLSGQGIATSATYFRGEHIYDPLHEENANGIASLTVVAESIEDADRFATAAYAMGEDGIRFISETPGLEGFAINWDHRSHHTPGFQEFLSE